MYAFDRNDPKLQIGAYVSVAASDDTDRRELYEVVARDENVGTVVVENCLTDDRHPMAAYRVATQFKLERAAPEVPHTVEEGMSKVAAA